LRAFEGTLKLFDDRWIQSAKWTGSRQNLAATEAFMPSSSSLGTAETVSYKSGAAASTPCSPAARSTASPGWSEHRREQFSFDSIFLFGPDLDAARNGRTRTTTGVAGEYVLDLLATGTTASAAVRQDFNDPFKDELTWRFSLVAESGADRRTAAHQRRARRHQSKLHRAVRLLTSSFVPNPDLVPGKLDRLGRGLGAELLERPRRRPT